ncbi:single-strand DNA-binding protein [Nocardioides terrae]|uniref:Single-stranded DNA-binding protein n=1 Tax=Nocardioides terrae TaxID=574651 RepID=A0A1I1DNT1_9ACTN|nr:single-stranded DNA-binding protein [Nocardioides terrae]SFB76514.1 single-strand DNA-binding protein [Nocardioides terrae]
MNDTQITVQGFVGATPGLKKAGDTEVATFRLASTPRYLNRRTNEWVDAPTQWYTVNAWRGLARNVAESLLKGDGVTVVGRLNVTTWTAQDGTERTTLEIDATSVGHDLRHGTTRLSRNEKPADRPEAPPVAGPEAPAVGGAEAAA